VASIDIFTRKKFHNAGTLTMVEIKNLLVQWYENGSK
jgi:hypothetical protein